MPYRYFWISCDGRVVEIDLDKFAKWVGNRLLVAVYFGRKSRTITFYPSRRFAFSIPLETLSKLLKMLER